MRDPMTESREGSDSQADGDASRLDLAQARAAGILLDVLGGRSLDAVLTQHDAELVALGRHVRAVCRDLCFGVLRHHGRLKALLRPLLKKETQPIVGILLEVGAYQLVHTRTAPHAVVDHAVRAASALTHPAVGGFVNAVLRSLQRTLPELERAADATPEGRFSHPEWWIRRLRRDHPAAWRDILLAGQQHPPFTLRVNLRRQSRTAYLERLAAAGLAAEVVNDGQAAAIRLLTPCPVERLPGFADGCVSVQDASAQLAATLLNAQAGQRVLDACAAPGGKTAHLLEHTDGLDLVALDHDAQRLNRVEQTLQRLGLQATLRRADAADLDAWWDGRPFDRILLDAPCTGSGVTRRHPDIRWLRHSSDPARLAATQRALGAALWRTLKPGGTLLYVTCSLFAEEGPGFVQTFLADHPDALPIPLSGPAFTEAWVLPDELHDGFFYARFDRRAS